MLTNSEPGLRSSREAAGRVDPFVDELLIILGPDFLEAFGIQPLAMHALCTEVVFGREAERVIEARDCQVHVLAAVLEPEPEGRAAFATVGALGDGRAVVPVRLVIPPHLALLHILERDRD